MFRREVGIPEIPVIYSLTTEESEIKMSNITLSAVASLIAEKSRILIITHAHPDGDTLGSAYGLKHAISKYCDARVICADLIPERLKFITDGETDLRIERLEDFTPELIVAVDVAEPHLMGSYGEFFAGAIDLKIDHHVNGSEYARYNYIEGDTAAAGEIIYKLVLELELLRSAELSPECATALYAAISSDTGSFKYTNTRPSTLRAAADLMELGADTEMLNHRLYESKSANEVVATKLTLNGMNIYRQGTVVVFSITNKLKESNGLSDEDFGGSIDMLREIDGVELAMTIRQSVDTPEKFKISMRSSGSIKANELCGLFGGGGHVKAAGAAINAESPESAEYTVIHKVLAVIGYEA